MTGPWWDNPPDIRTTRQCPATLTPNPATRCTRNTHTVDEHTPTTWHTWADIRWHTDDHTALNRGTYMTPRTRNPRRLTDLVTARLNRRAR